MPEQNHAGEVTTAKPKVVKENISSKRKEFKIAYLAAVEEMTTVDKSFDIRKGLFKYTIIDSNKICMPKYVVAKLNHDKVNKSKKRKERKPLPYRGKEVKLIRDLNNLPSNEWREMNFGTFLKMIHSHNDEVKELNQNELKKATNTFNHWAKGGVVWKVANQAQWRAAYSSIRSCMTGPSHHDQIQYYLDHPKVFVPLVGFRLDKIVARCVCIKYRFSNFIMPVRIYTSFNVLGVDNLQALWEHLANNVEELGYRIPPPLLERTSYSNPDTLGRRSTHLLSECRYYLRSEFQPLTKAINIRPYSQGRLPYLDFPSDNGYIGGDLPFQVDGDEMLLLQQGLLYQYLSDSEKEAYEQKKKQREAKKSSSRWVFTSLYS